MQRALVLRQQPYRETSLLLELFTEQHGRVGAVARGGRGKNSSRRALLQSFRPLQVSWSGGGDLVTLSAAESDGPMVKLTGQALYCGWYLNELLMRLLPRRDAHEALYQAYLDSLEGLRAGRLQPSLRLFEKQLLDEAGYGLVLDVPDAEALYAYDFEQGPVAVSGASDDAIRGASLIALARGDLSDPQSLRDSKRLLRTALRRVIGRDELESVKALRALAQVSKAGSSKP